MPDAPIKVLLVDDDEDDYLITRDLLSHVRERRHQLDWINNYNEGLAAIKRGEHDLCLLDYRLGERTGLELLRELQASHARLPIILLTGQGDQEIDIESMKAGAADYLVKSRLTADTLERSIRYAIERKRTQETVRHERDFISGIMETSPSGIVVTDCDGKITFANRRAGEVLKLAEHAAQTANVLNWRVADMDGTVIPGQMSLLKNVLVSGEPALDLHHTIEFPGGERAILTSNATPLFSAEGRNDGMIVTVDDITQKLALETQLRQSQKMDSLGQLAAGVAHDINNILTIIQGHAGLLLAGAPPDSDAAKSASQIVAASDRAAGFIRHLLAFSRKQIYRTKILDLNTVLRNLESLLPRMLGTPVTLEIKCSEQLPNIAADTALVEQIVMNLAINARDAMPKGGKLVIETSALDLDPLSVRRYPEGRAGRFVCLTVTDNGCGMEPGVVHRIFEPFFTTKETGKGTGLGLATVYAAVKQLHGWIEVQSQVGVGTTFKIFLPASDQAIATPVAPAPVENVQGGKETILVAEDESALLELMRSTLGLYLYNVLTASSGQEALEVWEQHRGDIHLLLTDLIMPGGMTGHELAVELKKRKPGLKVIFTSGFNASAVGKDTANGDTTFLPKPYLPDDVARLVRNTLDARSPSPAHLAA
ncbi:MAG TPA: response regulator [Candidatus Acidoferrales bacterium]|nr:response regulator [Candidatus Acidoferrales bacterium]